MYSPKIPEHLIPVLYRLARRRGEPMTALVAEAVAEYLGRQAAPDAEAAPPASPTAPTLDPPPEAQTQRQRPRRLAPRLRRRPARPARP
jgi:hypothetical protein